MEKEITLDGGFSSRTLYIREICNPKSKSFATVSSEIPKTKYNYRSKCIGLFCKIDGMEILIFIMFVYEQKKAEHPVRLPVAHAIWFLLSRIIFCHMSWRDTWPKDGGT